MLFNSTLGYALLKFIASNHSHGFICIKKPCFFLNYCTFKCSLHGHISQIDFQSNHKLKRPVINEFLVHICTKSSEWWSEVLVLWDVFTDATENTTLRHWCRQYIVGFFNHSLLSLKDLPLRRLTWRQHCKVGDRIWSGCYTYGPSRTGWCEKKTFL